jgi:pterin-4a-carbinolamine dehydratase
MQKEGLALWMNFSGNNNPQNRIPKKDRIQKSKAFVYFSTSVRTMNRVQSILTQILHIPSLVKTAPEMQ